MPGINGVPHPRAGDFFKKVPKGKHTGSSCAVTLFGLLAAPWVLDVLLAGSAVAS